MFKKSSYKLQEVNTMFKKTLRMVKNISRIIYMYQRTSQVLKKNLEQFLKCVF